MLAIARILRTGAKLLLLDEPTEGLAPVIVQQIGAMIREIKQRGFTVLLVEQNFRFAQTVADRHYVMEHGQVVDMVRERRARRLAWTGCTSTWASDARRLRRGRRRIRENDRCLNRRSLLAGAAAAAPGSRCRSRRARAQGQHASRSAC